MPQSEKKHFILLLPIVGALCVLIVSIFFYNLYIGNKITELSDDNLEHLVNNSSKTFQLSFASNINLLESSASLLPVWDYLRYINFDSEDYRFLSRSFDYMLVINPYGYAVGSDSAIADLAETQYFPKALNGQTVISDPLLFTLQHEHAIVIATPMIAHGETRGVLAGVIYLSSLDKMLGDPIQGLYANLIVDSKGNILSNSVKNTDFLALSNVFEKIEQSHVESTEALTLFKNDIANNVSGQRLVHFDGEEHSIIYRPIGIKNWMIVSIIPEAIIQATTNSIVSVTAIVSIIVMSIVSIFGIIINSSQRNTLEKIAKIAYISQLTGINTLVKFKLDSKDFVAANSGKNFLLIKFDVENFRLINESLSSKEGDRVLKSMAKAISCQSLPACISAHIHADEFLVMLAYTQENVQQWRDVYSQRLSQLLGSDFNYNLRIVAGFYYLGAENNIDIFAAIEKVNIAHRYAKETKALFSVYSEEFLANAIKMKDIENHMEEALEKGEFMMFLQPELDLQSGKLVAAEALVRWQHADTMMRPDEFIPIFEQNGFILKLDMYMFEQACRYMHTWIKEGGMPFILSVNFSRKHLYSVDFVQTLVKICEKYDVQPQYMGIEVTESSMLNNEGDLIMLIQHLQSKGFKVFMDDFGSGYSSLGLLKNIPVDVLKLDKSFFTNMEKHERSIAVVNSVIQLSKSMNIKTVAEGVENLENVKILKDMGCDIIQGYYYAKPMFKDDFKTFYNSEASTITFDSHK